MAGKLRNITFLSSDATVMSVEHVSRILVRWQLAPTSQNLANLVFYVDRGESPRSLAPISPAIPSTELYEFLDYTGKLLNLSKVYYYQVRAVELVSNVALNTFYSETFTWLGDLDLMGLYIVEEHLFKHEFVDGSPIVIFKRRQEGVSCPGCYDRVLKRVTRSDCTLCFGTGFLDGYYSPIPGWIDLNPDPKLAQVADFGVSQVGQTDVQFTNYPILVIGDILVELKGNRYWRVANVRPTEKNRTTLLQFCRVDEINRSDIEYRLVVPDAVRLALLTELEQRNLLPEF